MGGVFWTWHAAVSIGVAGRVSLALVVLAAPTFVALGSGTQPARPTRRPFR